jgi:hypothetical protein
MHHIPGKHQKQIHNQYNESGRAHRSKLHLNYIQLLLLHVNQVHPLKALINAVWLLKMPIRLTDLVTLNFMCHMKTKVQFTLFMLLSEVMK